MAICGKNKAPPLGCTETLNSICDHRLANNFMKTSFCDVEAKVDVLTIFSFLFKKHFSASLMCN